MIRNYSPGTPISVGVLHKYDIDLKVAATNVTLRDGFNIDGSTSATLDNGLLTLGPLDIRGKPAALGRVSIVVNARDPVATLAVSLDFENLVSPRFGGLFDLNADLDGRGESMAALMGNLNGRFIASLEDVELKKSAMTKFGAGLFSRINPLGNDATMLECAIARFEVKDGMVDVTRKLAAQTTEVTWFGSGEIDLKTEELDLRYSPQTPWAIGSLTDLGLAKLITCRWHAGRAKYRYCPADVAKKYASYSAFIASGGLSFLAEKVFDNVHANMDHCKRILADLEKE